MPRFMRIEYPGAIYHVMSRGNRQEAIFVQEADRYDVLKTREESDLSRHPKSAPGKRAIAARLRRGDDFAHRADRRPVAHGKSQESCAQAAGVEESQWMREMDKAMV